MVKPPLNTNTVPSANSSAQPLRSTEKLDDSCLIWLLPCPTSAATFVHRLLSASKKSSNLLLESLQNESPRARSSTIHQSWRASARPLVCRNWPMCDECEQIV